MTTPIKLLLSTDSPVIHTGLAETTRLIFNRLLSKFPGKYTIEQIGWYHYPTPNENPPWPIHATKSENGKYTNGDKYGQESFEGVLEKVQPDIVYVNGDIWCFEHLLKSPNRNRFRLASYYTIDGQPYWGNDIKPGKSSHWGSLLAKTDKLVVLTEFGEETLKNSCPELKNTELEVIYHPIDLPRFHVLDKEEKLEKRKEMWAPDLDKDAFVMGWIGRNQFRKMNYKMWEVLHYLIYGDYIKCNDCGRITRKEWDHCAMKSRDVGRLRLYDPDYDYTDCWYCKSESVVEGTPHDDIYLWAHMNKQDPGWNPNVNAAMWDVTRKIVFTNGINMVKGLSSEHLAGLISTWDCMLYLSGGEGFGIPAYEAMACGVPSVYTNYSSHADFCQHGGYPVRCEFIPELAFNIQRSQADVNHAIEQCLHAYYDRETLAEKGRSARAFVETKALDSIVDKWDKVFTTMMQSPIGTNNSQRVYAEQI
jgi:glycosyltransferase involved in cell wall biosynthesis